MGGYLNYENLPTCRRRSLIAMVPRGGQCTLSHHKSYLRTVWHELKGLTRSPKSPDTNLSIHAGASPNHGGQRTESPGKPAPVDCSNGVCAWTASVFAVDCLCHCHCQHCTVVRWSGEFTSTAGAFNVSPYQDINSFKERHWVTSLTR